MKRLYQSERQRQRQAKILYQTRKLANRVGYDGLTMRALAGAAGVSPKTLYNLFSSKDELLRAALEDLVTIIDRTADERIGAQGFDRILEARRTATEAIVRSPGFANVVVSLFFRASPEDRLVSALLGGDRESSIPHLEYERSRGAILDGVDLEVLAHHLAAQSWGTMLLWDKGLMHIDQIVLVEQRNYLTTFAGIAAGSRRLDMEQALERLNRLATEPQGESHQGVAATGGVNG